MTRTGSSPKSGRNSQGLAAKIRKTIFSGRLAGGDYLPTVREYSAVHKVSTDTVCRALRSLEAEGLILSESRQGYRVLPRANDPRRGCPLAVIIPRQRRRWDEVAVGLVEELRAATAARGWSLLAIGAGDLAHEQILGQMRAGKAWGALVNVDDPVLLDMFVAERVPTLLLETWRPDSRFDTVVQDGFRGAMAAADWLLSRGRRRIAWFGFEPRASHPQVLERYAGAAAALTRAGLAIAPEMHFSHPMHADNELEVARRVLAGPDRPDGVLALWKANGHALAAAAAEQGLVHGRDFDLVGWSTLESMDTSFGQLPAGAETPPVMSWSVRAMAEAAVDRLDERRSHPNAQPITIEIPVKLAFPGAAGTEG